MPIKQHIMDDQYFDFTIHFSPKHISVEEVEARVRLWLKLGLVDIPGDQTRGTQVIMHHCFIPRKVVERKAMDPQISDLLDRICKKQASWYSAGAKLEESRDLMLQNLRRVDGVALFVGPLEGGVKEEAEMAEEGGTHTFYLDQ